MNDPEFSANDHDGPTVVDVVIIGGGLSGVMIAHEIQRKSPWMSWNLLEAGPVLGGRLADDPDGMGIDLGGAWVWPQFQPNMTRLSKRCHLRMFRQPDDDSCYRIDGGAVKLIHALAKELPEVSFQLDCAVSQCCLIDAQCDNRAGINKIIRVTTTTHECIFAKYVVVAVPPRIAWKHIEFEPPLSQKKQNAMAKSHTWMAGVTKVALVYSKRFWTRDMSNLIFPHSLGGPAFQVYDASTQDGSVNALTFFTLVSPGSALLLDDRALGDRVTEQLAEMWRLYTGRDLLTQVKAYEKVYVKRWPNEKYISEEPNPTRIQSHPQPVAELSENEWEDQLLFAGTESDLCSPGVMEGAVGAALRVLQTLQSFFPGVATTAEN